MADRECGTCVACCVYYNIKTVDFRKEAFTSCHKLREIPIMVEEPRRGRYTTTTCNNCTIHDQPEKPKICDDFNCFWKLGNGEELDRPDLSGIVIDRSKRIENSHEAKPLWAGACDTEEGKELLERMSRSLGTPIIVLSWGEMKIDRIVGRGIK